MAKYGTGESVRFKASELLVSAGRNSVKIGTGGLVGRITGSVETTGEETKYYVEVKLPDGTFAGVSDVTLKLTALESQIQSEKEHLDAKFDEFIKRVIPSFNPDPNSWIRSFLNGKPYPKRYVMGVDLGRPEVVASSVSKEVLDSLREFARTGNVHHADGLVPADGGDKKMSKSRCVKLLESYRAEREKVKKGRKFERCLRDSVVDEALERAIELLKE